MCWSESADLVMGGVITGIGLVGIGLARDRRDIPLAALPVLLGAHQLIESRIWSESAGEGSVIRGPAVVAWTAIAFLILPVLVPAVLLRAERRRRRVQYLAALLGLPVAAVMAYAIRSGTFATDRGHVMEYGAGIPGQPLVLAGYLIAVCVPFLTSPERTMRELGVALVLGAVAATAANVLAFASIWCALAAIVSLIIVRRTVHASRHLPPEQI